MGEPLRFDSVDPRGHAIEFRINAEDPGRTFMPNPGTIVDYREPAGFGVRVDSGYRAGSSVSQYYDNLIAKLVVWGRDRDEAIARSRRALDEYVVTGIKTTIPFHKLALDHHAFVDGTHHTKTVEDDMDLSSVSHPAAPAIPEAEELAEREMTVEVGGRRFTIRLWAPELPAPTAPGGRRTPPRRRPPKLQKSADTAEGEGVITAPMQGTIVKVHHKAGENVESGTSLFILEAMKMENEIKSPVDGAIVEMRVQAGDKVSSGQVLAIVR
jgi:acetyl-CoA/propionyl-CoA carboxylase biotin carboxyl carrier protein